MRPVKFLVVEHEVQTREAVDEILTTLGYGCDYASSLAEARQFLAANAYACVLLGHEIPARVGGRPRIQNSENFLDDWARPRADRRPPVVVMFTSMRHLDEEDVGRWFADMRLRGATTFLLKPFRDAGRTPDRVIKKLLAGQPDPIRLDGQTGGTEKPLPDVPTETKGNIIPIGPLPPVIRQVLAAADVPAKRQPAGPPRGAESAALQIQWAGVPNEPIELDDFMAEFCEPRSKQNRIYRKRALLAAARHKTVTLPPQALVHKHGQANRYFTHDLLRAWQKFLDEGVDVPPLLAEHRPVVLPGQAAEKIA